MRPRINFVTLGVSNMGNARTFYERLGLTASAASNANVTFFEVNGVILALFGHDSLAHDANVEAAPAPAYRGVALAWNASCETETDAIIAHAVACGATLVKKGEKVFWGGYSGYFADPDGHLWEVAYNPFFPINAEGRVQVP